jgi:YegS/Rv2252/BmrU family lipid kinase
VERALIVYNPVARNAPSQKRLLGAAQGLKDAGWQVDLGLTEGAGHGSELARSAAKDGTSVVFACGGDGTVNEVVNGLAGSDCALGLIRGGMGNVFAKEIGVPRDPRQALQVLVEGERGRFDLGVAAGDFVVSLDVPNGVQVDQQGALNGSMGGERYFLLMAGVGFDASVVRNVPSKPKQLLGSTAYALWGVRELTRYQVQRAQLRLEGKEQEVDLFWLLLGNTRSYGGVLDITSNALADDGLLDVYTFAGRGLPWTASAALRLALGRHEKARGVFFERLSQLEVVTPGLPVQADGEHFGETPMRFSVAPGALEVLMPRGGGEKLLANRRHETTP